MKYQIHDIIDFVREGWGDDRPIYGHTELERDLGVVGDDWDELITAYADKFSVDMSSCLWYFHTEEEGQNIGAIFFNPPNRRVKCIPVTVAMLHRFANAGVWEVAYPEHSIPKARWDIRINRVFAGFGLVAIGFILYFKYFRS